MKPTRTDNKGGKVDSDYLSMMTISLANLEATLWMFNQCVGFQNAYNISILFLPELLRKFQHWDRLRDSL